MTRKAAGPGFTVTIRPVHVFPLSDPDKPGTIVTRERRIRVYDDVVTFDALHKEPTP